MAVCPSAWNRATSTGRIFVKFDVRIFFLILKLNAVHSPCSSLTVQCLLQLIVHISVNNFLPDDGLPGPKHVGGIVRYNKL